VVEALHSAAEAAVDFVVADLPRVLALAAVSAAETAAAVSVAGGNFRWQQLRTCCHRWSWCRSPVHQSFLAAGRSAWRRQATNRHWRGRHWRGPGYGFGAGLALGALGSSYYYDPYYYDDSYAYAPDGYVDDGQYAAVPASDSDAAYCAQRYKSYDPASGTYLNYDGNRYPCP
jgi:hypothetical protein